MDDLARSVCPHCGVAVDAPGTYCCLGCEAAAALIQRQHLESYQAWASEPLPRGGAPTSRAFLGPTLAQREGTAPVVMDVQGITCGACVWVLEEVAQRHGVEAIVNPGVGRLTVYNAADATLQRYLDDVETLGYRLGPATKRDDAQRDELVLRAGLTAALAMISMSLSFSRYFGLDDGPVAELFLAGEVALAALAVIVGGWVFISATWRALRFGVVSFDAPIALGIVAAFAGSTVNLVLGSREGLFFDAVTTFIALMVGGRLVQRSLLVRSRSQLLADSGLLSLPVAALDDDGVVVPTTAAALGAGARVLLRRGDILPAAGVANVDVDVSLAWITGEVEPRAIIAGGTIPAGASLTDGSATVVTLSEAPQDSALAAQLSTTRHADESQTVEGWHRFALVSVGLVVLAAVGAAVAWTLAADLPRGLAVATAVLVVTCPCAIGLALPLVDELAARHLRRIGVFVRRAGLYERLQHITQVVLDKTGTVTVGTLEVQPSSLAALADLSPADAARLAQVACRSTHPKSQAVVRALERLGVRPPLDLEVAVHEVAGQGLSGVVDGVVVQLGRASSGTGETVAQVGSVAVPLAFEETLQRDAQEELRRLRARGLELILASGDETTRVAAVAERLGVQAWHHSLRPADKAALVQRLGAEQVLFVGDGINDAQAFDAAGVSGTPALDHPQLPARADFYVVHRGLGPISTIFDVADRHRRASHAALIFAIAYNAVVVPLALAGVLTPQVCALLMPLSSVAVVVLVQVVFSRPTSAVQDRTGDRVGPLTTSLASPTSATANGAPFSKGHP